MQPTTSTNICNHTNDGTSSGSVEKTRTNSPGCTYAVATRGSRLSIAQTRHVIDQLLAAAPDTTYDVITITTKGDTDSRPLFTIDQKGIFEKEVDMAVEDGRADFAVHSLKDIPSELPDGLVLACVPKREHPDDVLITTKGHTLKTLPPNATIGTSSLRRAVQISRARPDVRIRPIRGNIETRISKLDSDQLDGIVLAYAGLSRLRIDVRYTLLPVKEFVPSPGQGALAIVSRSDDTEMHRVLQKIEDPCSRAEADAERALSAAVGSGCRFPVGALARQTGDTMSIRADAFSVDGKEVVAVEETAYDKESPAEMGRRAGQNLLSKGAKRLALNWREGLSEWNGTS